MGQLNIPDSAIVYAGTSVFIYTVEANSNYYSLLQPRRSCLFLTNDSQFRRVAGLPVVVLDDVLSG